MLTNPRTYFDSAVILNSYTSNNSVTDSNLIFKSSNQANSNVKLTYESTKNDTLTLSSGLQVGKKETNATAHIVGADGAVLSQHYTTTTSSEPAITTTTYLKQLDIDAPTLITSEQAKLKLKSTSSSITNKDEQTLTAHLTAKRAGIDPGFIEEATDETTPPNGVQFNYDAGFMIPNPNSEQQGQPATINVRISDLYNGEGGGGNYDEIIAAICRVIYNQASNQASAADRTLITEFADNHPQS